jgi:hypothetical protein
MFYALEMKLPVMGNVGEKQDLLPHDGTYTAVRKV